MLSIQVQQVLRANPEYASITPVIEKEILHHDIMSVMINQGVMQSLTFIGGTSLRLCYNSPRLSEDLDFNAGFDFKPEDFSGLEVEIQRFLMRKYETQVWVHPPSVAAQGNTRSWKVSIEKAANRPDLPQQKIHLDVCALPSFDIEKRPLMNHYGLMLPTEGLLIPVQSLAEALVDKFIALAYRARRIKPRDLWDILWIHQRGQGINEHLLKQKLAARQKTWDDFKTQLNQQLVSLQHRPQVQQDFMAEMTRFIPAQIKARTLDNPDYWPYVQGEISRLAKPLLEDSNTAHPFEMG
jgi:predicted nucleotidyltransferase component of viral defense system